jgi:hypothetical protein
MFAKNKLLEIQLQKDIYIWNEVSCLGFLSAIFIHSKRCGIWKRDIGDLIRRISAI